MRAIQETERTGWQPKGLAEEDNDSQTETE